MLVMVVRYLFIVYFSDSPHVVSAVKKDGV
jgi:hypothetical protein